MKYSGVSPDLSLIFPHHQTPRTNQDCSPISVSLSNLQKRDRRTTMADELGCNGANIILDPSVESFHNMVREEINERAQAAIAGLDAAYRSSSQVNPQAHGVQVIFNISYSFRSLGTQAELEDQVAERDHVDVAEDLAQLNMDIIDRIRESCPRDTENHTAEKTRWTLPSSIARLFSSTARLSTTLPRLGSQRARYATDTRLQSVIGRACSER